MPAALDKETLKAYAESCGTELALKWASDELGVDVKGCAKPSASAAAECVAANYGAELDVIKDGKVNWNAVVRDAGAVGGIVVCATFGLEVAAPVCGKIGAELAAALVKLGEFIAKIGETILTAIFGSDDVHGWACGPQPFNTVPLRTSARDVAFWVKQGARTYQPFAPIFVLGDIVPDSVYTGKAQGTSTSTYWGRLFQLRAAAQVTAALTAALAEKTGLSPAEALALLAPAAPSGWFELVRSSATPSADLSAPNFPDWTFNLGGMLSTVMQGPDRIRPRWQEDAFWSGIGKPTVLNTYSFMVSPKCPDDSVVWSHVPNPAAASAALVKTAAAAKARPENQTYWLYTVPDSIDTMLGYPDPIFAKLLQNWRDSISGSLDDKITRGRALAVKPTSSALPKMAVAAGVAGAAVWLFRLLKVKHVPLD